MKKIISEGAKTVHKRGREMSAAHRRFSGRAESAPKNWFTTSVEEQVQIQLRQGKVDNPFALFKGKYAWPEDETKDAELYF